MASNTFYPHTREQDTGSIVRTVKDFSGGIMKDTNETTEPSNFVSELINARGFTDSYRGRYGSSLWSDTELPCAVSIYGQFNLRGHTINNILADGIDISQRMISVDIDGVRRVHSITETDYIYNKLFIDGNVTSETDIVLTEIHFYDPINASYYDEETNVEYYLIGTQIYILSNGTFIPIHGGYGIIVSASSTFIRIENSIVLFNDGGIFSSRLIDNVTDHIHCAIFTRRNIAPPQFKVINNPDQNPTIAYNYMYSYSDMHNNYLETRNTLSETNYIVSETPTQTTDRTKSVGTHKIFDTDLYYYPSEVFKPYTTAYSNVEINHGITTIRCGGKNDTPSQWVDIAADNDLIFYFTVGSGYSRYGGKLIISDKVRTMDEVATALEIGFNSSDSPFTMSVRWSIEGFMIREITDGLPVKLATLGNPRLFDLCLHVNPDNGTTWLTLTPDADIVPSSVTTSMYVYPSEVSSVTTYSIYRSKNVFAHTDRATTTNYDDRSYGNIAESFSWIYDLPVCSIIQFGYNSVTQIVTFPDVDGFDTFIPEYMSDEFTFSYGNKISVGRFISVGDVIKYEHISGQEPLTADEYIAFFGVQDQIEVTQSTTPTTINGVEAYKLFTTRIDGHAFDFDESDHGRLMFWSDGTFDISIVEDKQLYITHKFNDPTTTRYMGYHPTHRSYTDRVTDITQNGYMSVWNLNSYDYTPLSNANHVEYNKGVILSSSKDDNTVLEYTAGDDYRYIGYHNGAFQRITSITNPITAIMTSSDIFTVFTSESTFTINPSQAYSTSNKTLGTSMVMLPMPILIDDVRGVANGSRVINGPNGDLFVFTNEPAIRMFSNSKYSGDYSEGTVHKSLLTEMSSIIAMNYNTVSGLTLWGARENE